ncbi:MAG: hypothetical protein A2017_19950 [Lentisphaerae bacterium GWF2_44_16]|nr:MAG: hypothetical protein A2017_19950 [Lentisphaerae bacterium GWF2_44_16]
MSKMKICSKCVMDESVPSISFDENGVCNYCKLHDTLTNAYPTGEDGAGKLKTIVKKIKSEAGKKNYDCVIGVSGGTDSTYLLHWAKENGLRPLAVHLDNGWDSEIAVGNIKKSVAALGIDLQTYVIDWEEIKDILRSFLKASFPWADLPTDIAIISSLYKIAAEENIRYVIAGNNFRIEGKQPIDWTYGDGRLVKAVHKIFGNGKMNSYPNLTIMKFFYYTLIRKIKIIRPFYYMNFDKKSAQKMLEERYAWVNYGGHHHESIFTRFIIGCWLPRKFNIDKRKVTWSALVREGQMSRNEALEGLKELPYDAARMKEDIDYVAKKLDLTHEELEKIFALPNKTFRDYPSYFPLFVKMKKLMIFVFRFMLPWKPPFFYQLDSK